jgi:cytochrome c oxidase subunit 2
VSDTAIVTSAHRSRPRTRPRFVTAAATAVLVLAGAACGDDTDGGQAAGQTELSGAAARGEQLAEDTGCTTCHSTDGTPKTGPTWQGVWGSEVELTDGRTVVVDRIYVERSIREPTADVVDGFTPIMPEVDLADDEIDDLVAYIEALGDAPS